VSQHIKHATFPVYSSFPRWSCIAPPQHASDSSSVKSASSSWSCDSSAWYVHAHVHIHKYIWCVWNGHKHFKYPEMYTCTFVNLYTYICIHTHIQVQIYNVHIHTSSGLSASAVSWVDSRDVEPNEHSAVDRCATIFHHFPRAVKNRKHSCVHIHTRTHTHTRAHVHGYIYIYTYLSDIRNFNWASSPKKLLTIHHNWHVINAYIRYTSSGESEIWRAATASFWSCIILMDMPSPSSLMKNTFRL